MPVSAVSRPPLSADLAAYDYVRGLTRSRVAWEYLRRNPAYRRDYRLNFAGRPKPIRLSDGTVLLRARRRFRGAEVWGLYIFRRPGPRCA